MADYANLKTMSNLALEKRIPSINFKTFKTMA